MAGVLADCGNTRIKLRWAGATVVSAVDVRLDEALAAVLAPVLVAGSSLTLVASGLAAADRLERAWLAAGGAAPSRIGRELPLPDLGQYPSCGADRVLAGLAAVSQRAGPCVVVDAGTATTLSAWDCDGQGVAHFAGGLILPGAEACLAGLVARVPQLPLVAPASAAADPRAMSTAAALANGIGIGYPSLVKSCAERLLEATGIEAVVLTGGASDALRAALPGALLRADLVLDGLAMLAQ